VIVLDDDPAWHRAMRRSLRELDVRRVYNASSRDDLETLLVDLDPCVVLTELEMGAARLAGLNVLDTAYAFRAPAALVASCASARLDPLRYASFLRKSHVTRASLHALLVKLEARLPRGAKLLPER
jgi:hypothetical protein